MFISDASHFKIMLLSKYKCQVCVRVCVCVGKCVSFLLMPGCQESLQLVSKVKGCVSLSLPLCPTMPVHTHLTRGKQALSKLILHIRTKTLPVSRLLCVLIVRFSLKFTPSPSDVPHSSPQRSLERA